MGISMLVNADSEVLLVAAWHPFDGYNILIYSYFRKHLNFNKWKMIDGDLIALAQRNKIV